MVTSCERAPILVVDDDAAIREALSEFLVDEGYLVAVAANGREALERIREPARPCVILLDLSMPVMDGLAFRAAQLQEPALSDIPVVVITAGGRTQPVPEGVPVLPKPIDLDQLLAHVGRYC